MALAVAAPAAVAQPARAASAERAATPEIPRSLPDGYVVLPFANASGVAGLEWMRAALPAALAEKLEAHSGLRPAYADQVVQAGAGAGASPGEGDIAAAAGAARARFAWTGSFTRPSWKLELTLRLWSVEAGRATLVGEQRGLGDFADWFDLLDTAALDLLARAGRPAPAADAARMRRAPTRDFYAFTLYGRGLVAIVGLGGPVDLGKAEKDLARAVFIDPKFAEAHRMLAVVLGRKGQPGKARGNLTYALDLRPE